MWDDLQIAEESLCKVQAHHSNPSTICFDSIRCDLLKDPTIFIKKDTFWQYNSLRNKVNDGQWFDIPAFALLGVIKIELLGGSGTNVNFQLICCDPEKRLGGIAA